jgi:ferredoxin
MTYRILIDHGACSGFGSCVESAPGIFALGPEGTAEAPAETSDRAAAVAAAQSCPMGAISILDEEGRAVR